jgi:type I restriction enzyme S subunit
MNNWTKLQIGKAISFNPPESISKGKEAKKIPMGSLTEFQRKVDSYELSNYNSGPKFRNGDTIMAKITPCLENGKTAYVDILEDDEVAFGSSEYIVLRKTFHTDSLYIYYLAISPTFRKRAISCMEGTSGRKRVSEKTLKYFELDFPPVSTQKQIAKVLSDLDVKIEINNKINQQLEAMAKTLYDYWFVQFDFPDKNGKPYKSSGGLMVFNEELKRDIPEGWDAGSLSSWIKNDKSGDWGKAEEQGNYVNKVSCIRGADLNGLNGKGTIKSPTRFVLEKNSHKLLEVGDFIIEISGGSPTQSTGRMAFITKETLERFENPLICSNFCKAVTLKEEKALYNFAYEWNRLYDAGVLFGWEGKTSGIKNLLFESFVTNHKVSIPSAEIMELFYEKAKPIHSKIQTNLKQNQKLSELRDWLLPMLMNGQVSVGRVTKEEESFGLVAEGVIKYGER